MELAYVIPEMISVSAYLGQLDETRTHELVFGYIRRLQCRHAESAKIADSLSQSLASNVYIGPLARMMTAPVDVVLDVKRCLVVHPAAAVMLPDRQTTIRTQVWGAPNIIMEVLTPDAALRIRHIKLRWYRYYGVQEIWLIDPRVPNEPCVEVYHCSDWFNPTIYTEGEVHSEAVPGFTLSLDGLFLDRPL